MKLIGEEIEFTSNVYYKLVDQVHWHYHDEVDKRVWEAIALQTSHLNRVIEESLRSTRE